MFLSMSFPSSHSPGPSVAVVLNWFRTRYQVDVKYFRYEVVTQYITSVVLILILII